MRIQNRLQPLHPANRLGGQSFESQLGLVALNLPSESELERRYMDLSFSIEQESTKPLSSVTEEEVQEGSKKSDWVHITAALSEEPVSKTAVSADSNTEEVWIVAKEAPTTGKAAPLPKDDTKPEDDSPPGRQDGGSQDAKYSPNVKRASSPSKAIDSSSASPSRHQHTSVSWSGDDGACSSVPLSPKPSSYSTHFPLEHLPPLLSYDEAEEGWGRSPRLHGNSEVLSEEEQLTLHASMSDIATSHSDQSDGNFIACMM